MSDANKVPISSHIAAHLTTFKHLNLWKNVNKFVWSFYAQLNHEPTRPYRSLTAYFSEIIKGRNLKFCQNPFSSLHFVLSLIVWKLCALRQRNNFSYFQQLFHNNFRLKGKFWILMVSSERSSLDVSEICYLFFSSIKINL